MVKGKILILQFAIETVGWRWRWTIQLIVLNRQRQLQGHFFFNHSVFWAVSKCQATEINKNGRKLKRHILGCQKCNSSQKKSWEHSGSSTVQQTACTHIPHIYCTVHKTNIMSCSLHCTVHCKQEHCTVLYFTQYCTLTEHKTLYGCPIP